MDRADVLKQFLNRFGPDSLIILGDHQHLSVGSFSFLQIILDTDQSEDPAKRHKEDRPTDTPDERTGNQPIFPIAKEKDRNANRQAKQDRNELHENHHGFDQAGAKTFHDAGEFDRVFLHTLRRAFDLAGPAVHAVIPLNHGGAPAEQEV